MVMAEGTEHSLINLLRSLCTQALGLLTLGLFYLRLLHRPPVSLFSFHQPRLLLKILLHLPFSITHPVIISTPISQTTPTPVPAAQDEGSCDPVHSCSCSCSLGGKVTGVQPPSMPAPAPRLRAARTQPDLYRGFEELARPPASLSLHPPPDPAFHALTLSLVRLAELFPAQAPDALAQAAALSPH